MRLHNLTAEPTTGSIAFGLPLRGAWPTDLLEERTGPLETRDHGLDLDVAPHRIETIEVKFEG